MEIPVKKVDTLNTLEWDDVRKEKEAAEKIDFKMVTFSLGGKDYGIDIMRVKEISKANRFTYVPNALPYVRGVYNLRGDIISVIDLRLMFHIPIPERPENSLENMLILRLDEYSIAVLVDSIDRVVGISSEKIQPPHPLFGDINIQFISGIVEHDKRLFIILDAERIFGSATAEKSREEEHRPEREAPEPLETGGGDADFGFITETLITFRNFHHSSLNTEWLQNRVVDWRVERERIRKTIQLQDPKDADDFLSPFYSPCTGLLWSDDFRNSFVSLLPPENSGNYTVWNLGCGQGYESYSLACILHDLYSDCRLKIWAQDQDLLAISSAPTLLVGQGSYPDFYREFIAQGKDGLQFESEIRDLIMFEYHDARNPNDFPNVDLIVARDILSFLTPEEQDVLIDSFAEKLKPNGFVMIGSNEILPETEWIMVHEGRASLFRKR